MRLALTWLSEAALQIQGAGCPATADLGGVVRRGGQGQRPSAHALAVVACGLPVESLSSVVRRSFDERQRGIHGSMTCEALWSILWLLGPHDIGASSVCDNENAPLGTLPLRLFTAPGGVRAFGVREGLGPLSKRAFVASFVATPCHVMLRN